MFVKTLILLLLDKSFFYNWSEQFRFSTMAASYINGCDGGV